MSAAGTSTDHGDVATQLAAWSQRHYQEACEVVGVHRMPGHSGITYGFDIVRQQAGTVRIVMRVPPVGVRHLHNLDVVRLAPVLSELRSAGVPVPAVVDASTDESIFGTPYLMVSRENGAPLPDVFESSSTFPSGEQLSPLFSQALCALAQVHATDPTSLLTQGWATPISVADDLNLWTPLLQKSEVEAEIRQTERLQSKLLATAPAVHNVAIVHGDFYSNNWLFDEGSLTALLDWENSTLNNPMWDLGWIATIYDPQCWGPSRGPMDWAPSVADLYSWYESARLCKVVSPNWYQALMCYRLACITPSKVRLHRLGRRVDPIWEVFAEAVPYQLDRAFQLLQEDL